MRHLADDELVLYHYHDGDDIETAERHLASCPECRSRLVAIEEVLHATPAHAHRGTVSHDCWRAVNSGSSARIRFQTSEP